MEEIDKLKEVIKLYEISTKMDYEKIEKLKEEINKYIKEIDKLKDELLTLKNDFKITTFEYQK